VPPVPPFWLPNPGSLNTDPGELPEWPGVESWPAEFAVFWQVLPGGPAYAGAAAAPVMTMPARQLAAKSVRIMITFRFRARATAHPIPLTRRRPPSRSKFVPKICCTRPLAGSGADLSDALADPLIDDSVKLQYQLADTRTRSSSGWPGRALHQGIRGRIADTWQGPARLRHRHVGRRSAALALGCRHRGPLCMG
jgi:hypothetical protein